MSEFKFPTRSFGFEIETSIPKAYTEDQFQPGQYHQGEIVQGGDCKWNCQRDGSLRATKPGYSPVEIVSSILSGQDGLSEVYGMVSYLQEIKAHSNKTMGIHVHVDARDVTPEQLATIKEIFASLELAFYGLNGKNFKQRYFNQFCKPSGNWDNTKYQSLNWQNWVRFEKKKTIEFRMFSSIIDPMHAFSAVLLAVTLIDGIVTGKITRKSWSAENVVEKMGDLIVALDLHQDPELKAELLPYLMLRATEAQQAQTGVDPIEMANDILQTMLAM